jgi:hypothetical protein
LAYEFVLAYKAKTIITPRKAYYFFTYADFIFLFTVVTRIIFATGTMATTTILHTSRNNGSCINKYDARWIMLNNFSRHFNDILWSGLFLLPIYRVLKASEAATLYDKFKEFPYKKIFAANLVYPLVAVIISTIISIVLIMQDSTGPWYTLLFGAQNFIGTYTINLILNVKVGDRRTEESDGTTGTESSVEPNSSRDEGYKYPETREMNRLPHDIEGQDLPRRHQDSYRIPEKGYVHEKRNGTYMHSNTRQSLYSYKTKGMPSAESLPNNRRSSTRPHRIITGTRAYASETNLNTMITSNGHSNYGSSTMMNTMNTSYSIHYPANFSPGAASTRPTLGNTIITTHTNNTANTAVDFPTAPVRVSSRY